MIRLRLHSVQVVFDRDGELEKRPGVFILK